MATIVGLQSQMAVGENPLNRNGILLTSSVEDEDMVFTTWKHVDVLIMEKI